MMFPMGEVTDATSGSEPDYRVSLAIERTYLAYVRTSLALLAAGVAVVGAFPDAGYVVLRRTIGVVLVVGGLVLALGARGRQRQVDAAVRRSDPLPRSRLAVPISIAIALAAVLSLVLVVRL
jgi:putative membrane protein